MRITNVSNLLCAAALAATPATAEIRICVTTPDLASLAFHVGAERESITVFVKGPQDPHFVDPKPSFIKSLSRADLFAQVGAGLELGWAPALLDSSRNSTVRAGAKGFFDASRHVRRLQSAAVDRSAGDVHPEGNPHFLLDPLVGLAVAEKLAERLEAISAPSKGSPHRHQFERFRAELASRLLGERLLAKYSDDDRVKLLELLDRGGLEKLLSFLETQKQRELLGGWLGALAPHRGAKVVADHDIWPYFARRFGIEVTGFLEPKPGITPTTRHLTRLIASMRSSDVRAILSSAYFDRRHADFVASKTSAVVVEMAHQPGARPGTDGYLDMLDWNVKKLAEAFDTKKRE